MVSDKWCQQWYRALEICHHHHHALHHCLARNFDSRQIKNDDIKRKFAPHNAVNGLNSPSHIWRSSGTQIFWTCVEFWVWSESEWDFVTLARSQNALGLKCHRQSWRSGVLGILQLESVLFYSIYGDWGWYWANPQLSFWATGSYFSAIKPLIAYSLHSKILSHL